VGTIGLVDSDCVETSNLQRQVLHSTSRTGLPKVTSAQGQLEDLNPDTQIEMHPVRFTADNALELIGKYDLVIDGADNFETKYLLNDSCVLAGKTLIHAGVLQFDGQLLVIQPGQGPCLRCVFPDLPEAGGIPTCQSAGILGAVAGVMGLLQATETLKILSGVGQVLQNAMLVLSAATLSFRKIPVHRNLECAVCGMHPVILQPEEIILTRCSVREGRRIIPSP
jgi:adenylyltransferase/sulfurtransferase